MRSSRIDRQICSRPSQLCASSPLLLASRSICFHGGFLMYHPLINAIGENTTDCNRRTRSSSLRASRTSGVQSRPEKPACATDRMNVA